MKIAERFIELLARVGVLHCQPEACFRSTGATSSEGGAAKVEHGERDLEPLAQFTKNVFLWNLNVAQCEPSCRRAANSHFWHALLEHFESRHLGHDQKRGNCCFVRV